MSPPRSLEEIILQPIARALHTAVAQLSDDSDETRLEVLEAVASLVGGFSLAEYRLAQQFRYRTRAAQALKMARTVFESLDRVPIPPSLALAALARPTLHTSERRKSGAYYTDFRLAQYLAQLLKPLPKKSAVLDPASGTGILLVAVTLSACGHDRLHIARFLGNCVFAADRSPIALRGALLSLASMTDDLAAVRSLASHLRCHDSLLRGTEGWSDLVPGGFHLVIGNPPWEKLKVTRHEFLRASGVVRHYGDDYADGDDNPELSDAKEESTAYANELARLYPLQASGELDLYRAFLELSLRMTRSGGQLALLVPAGLIRSQGTLPLRRALLEKTVARDLTIFENRARFFTIDTRFKFLAVRAITGARSSGGILRLRYAAGTANGISESSTVTIAKKQLPRLRPDLTIPEVRNRYEWALFRTMFAHGALLGDAEGPWKLQIVREVDMTRDRANFSRSHEHGHLALVEGRMVHQHRFGAKSYVSGTGRSALWSVNPLGGSALHPQFWYPASILPPAVRERTAQARVGFCDITGQTNERSMLAALIPPDVVCGNKVPTITFGGEDQESHLAHLFLAISNSFSFDWLLRRVVTTTVNYFVLLGLPFPSLPPDGVPARRLISLARELANMDSSGAAAHAWLAAEKRAEIDVRVLLAYGLDLSALRVILADFPLLDRGQPALPDEPSSTITRDLLILRTSEFMGTPDARVGARVERARALGAQPYVPSEFELRTVLESDEATHG